MVNSNLIDLRKLNLEELTGVVSLYPWFALARVELCRRMVRLGDMGWPAAKFAEQALYLGSRSLVFDMLEKRDGSAAGSAESVAPRRPERQVFVVGGDYFSQSQYDRVRKADDAVFSRFAAKTRSEAEKEGDGSHGIEFCTEALAEIYAEQGYYEQAAKIYSKLILRYPEKSAYFATLAEKMNKEINN